MQALLDGGASLDRLSQKRQQAGHQQAAGTTQGEQWGLNGSTRMRQGMVQVQAGCRLMWAGLCNLVDANQTCVYPAAVF